MSARVAPRLIETCLSVVRLSVHFRLDPRTRAQVQRLCGEKGCSESDFYRDSVTRALGGKPETVNDHSTRPISQVRLRTNEGDIFNPSTGCISRYSPSGDLMFHLVPLGRGDSCQYYRDTLKPDSDVSWHWIQWKGWIATINAGPFHVE